jgi:hypothetical protein
MLTIIGYFLIVILFVFFRVPYRLGKTDSATRLIFQIQPMVFYYIAANSNRIKQWVGIGSESQTADKLFDQGKY